MIICPDWKAGSRRAAAGRSGILGEGFPFPGAHNLPAPPPTSLPGQGNPKFRSALPAPLSHYNMIADGVDDQFAERTEPKLGHDVFAVSLDRLHTHSQLGSHFLIGA